jgi:cation:H+ antiporter
MIENYLFLVFGIFLLAKGAKYLVEGISFLAKKLNISTIILSITIVSMGTTLPELTVNIIAAIRGSSEIALGNIIGSGITNMFLIMGLTAVLCPVKISKNSVWKELPLMFFSALILFVLMNLIPSENPGFHVITPLMGVVLLAFFGVFIYYNIRVLKKIKTNERKINVKSKEQSKFLIALMIGGGVAAMFIGGKLAVEGAVFIANQLGLREYLISATIIALGTSLPELFTAITAARRKETDIVVGNVFGDNVIYIFWVIGITALISPIIVPSFVNIDMIIMIAATLILLAFMFVGKKREIERWQGFVLLGCYLAYLAFIILRG